MKTFGMKTVIHFGDNALDRLREIPYKRVLIITDPFVVQSKMIDLITEPLAKGGIEYDIFSNVVPDAPVDKIADGVKKFLSYQPEAVIAVGGGSAIDSSKAIREFALKINNYGKVGLIAVPTTSGTGSEVTSFAVVNDTEAKVKYPLVSPDLTADEAILDAELVKSVPPAITADTGMDVLTHAIESYVSVMASDYTRGLSLQSIKLVFENLEHSYRFGDEESREKMHNASTMAGMAFANAFLGINHSLAHKVGPMFDIPHGRTNAILMPHVIRYNGRDPQKHAMFPKYDYFRADKDYADIARFMGWGTDKQSDAELVEVLAQKVYELGIAVGIAMNWKGQGVTKKLLQDTAYTLAEHAYEDQCTTANPKEPLISELKEIIEIAFDYKG